jgi:hypothetical protein
MTGEETISEIRRRHDTCVLAFSRGKDSIAAWLALRPHFERIIPVHYLIVPGLEFVEESVQYYERFFGCRIMRVPQPWFYRALNGMVFQTPDRVGTIFDYGLPEYDYDQLRRAISTEHDCPDPKGYYLAVGTRANDSPQRRLAFRRHGSIREKGRQFYPVWDWNKEKLIEAIKQSGCKLPPEYRVYGRSFDGIDFRFLWGVRRYWPRDYAKILEWFPLAELGIRRYESRCERMGVKP